MTEQPEQPQQPADPAEPPAEEQQAVGWLPRPAGALFGAGATAELAYDLLTVDVPADAWIGALTVARDELGCTYFDWLSAVDEPGTGFRICAHLADVARPGAVRRLIVRTTVPHDTPVLPTAVGVFAGAGWHERETHEMFGVDFTGHPHLVPLLLPDTFEGHPLRKDFVLAARVAKAWPGAKEPGEPAAGAAHGGPKRRQMLPPGVPDPNEWGPLKGQLPPAPARPARGARAAGAAGERPARRTRSASAGSASQQAAATEAPTTEAPTTEAPTTEAAAGAPAERPARAARPDRPPRRNRSVSQGSASQQAAAAPEPTAPPDAAPKDAAAEGTPAARRPAAPPRSADAPWHHARPAFEEAEAAGKPAPAPEPGPADAPPAQRPEEEGGDTP
ncbi:NADH-quinone oxidoreductase subunit C [Streptomyces sp. A1-5]|uniref:NADH-quinone oxidoreductase subunit C n=1 Tax=Streptomyces sp. A1-5 TaxID=2738410 RepID=UPI001F336E72|nr:NADH-quinone oxidoreductase subunit C [Streptomyces sp. A1-5]UJB42637.1 NADH-quinone oxidoreductase subunit C [Streptomyces sp. A1-5]